jgi:hypothetical protein
MKLVIEDPAPPHKAMDFVIQKVSPWTITGNDKVDTAAALNVEGLVL